MKHKALCLIVALTFTAALSNAHASVLKSDLDRPDIDKSDIDLSGDTPTVLFSQSTLVHGTAKHRTILDVPGAGELFVTLTKLDHQFTSLTFDLTSDPSALVGQAAPGTLTLDLTGPTTLYADVFATARCKDTGLYNLTATFLGDPPSSVPLPASGLLLGGGLLTLLLAGTRRLQGLTQSVQSKRWTKRGAASPWLLGAGQGSPAFR